MSALEEALEDYLRLRHALGHKLATAEVHLRRFVTWLEAAGLDTITTEQAMAFAYDAAVDPASVVPSQRMGAVRGFARFLAARDPRCEIPPAGLVTYRGRRRFPYLFTDPEINILIDSMRASTPFTFRAETLETLVRLLAVTGMRVGEALRLACGDIDWAEAALRVRDSKFHKGRDVPVSRSTIEALRGYAQSRGQRTGVTTDRFFISLRGTPVIYTDFYDTFRTALDTTGIGAEHPGRPRIHDLRHRFAIRTVTQWYRQGRDTEALLPRLSTYLGHREPRLTYWYLTATTELLEQAAARLEVAHSEAGR